MKRIKKSKRKKKLHSITKKKILENYLRYRNYYLGYIPFHHEFSYSRPLLSPLTWNNLFLKINRLLLRKTRPRNRNRLWNPASYSHLMRTRPEKRVSSASRFDDSARPSVSASETLLRDEWSIPGTDPRWFNASIRSVRTRFTLRAYLVREPTPKIFTHCADEWNAERPESRSSFRRK